MLQRKIYIGLLLSFLLIEMQYASEKKVSDKVTQVIKGKLPLHRYKSYASLPKVHTGLATNNTLSRVVEYPDIDDDEELLFNFDDAEKKEHCNVPCINSALKAYDQNIVIRWTSLAWLARIERNEKILHVPVCSILHDVIKIDDTLQKNKSKMKEELFQRQLSKIQSDATSQSCQTVTSLINMQLQDIEKIKDRLWLQYMHESCNYIHKNVEKTKVLNSYCAWPYIREIHTMRNFPTMYNDSRVSVIQGHDDGSI